MTLTAALRHHLGKRSVRWLSRESGLSLDTTQRIMAGEISPRVEQLEALAAALGCRVTIELEEIEE